MLPSQKNSFYGYLRALRPMVRGKDERAEELALDALRGLVSCRYPLLKKRLPKRRFIFSSAEQRSIERFVHWIQGQEVLEAAFWLSSLYAALVTEERRHGRALFFTPPELSRRLVSNLTDQGVNFATARFIDPACGGAAFLAPIAIAIRSKLRGRGVQGRRMLKHLERHLTGWDLDPTLRNLSCAFLWMAVYSDIAASGYVPRVAVSTGDSLRRIRRHRREYDVVICNPPYRKVSRSEFELLEPCNRALFHGQPNYYAIFMARALELAKGRGHVGLITPASFLSGKSFGPMRRHFVRRTHLKQIDLVDKRQGVFVGVEQEAVLTIFCRQRAEPEDETSVFAIGSNTAKLVGMVALPKTGIGWVLPRQQGDVELLPLHRHVSHTLKSYGYACRTGLYVPHRDKRKVSADRSWKESYPLIWSTDIGQDGALNFGKSHHKKRFIRIAKSDQKLLHRNVGVALQRTTSKDDVRRLIVAPVGEEFVRRYGGYVGENHVLFLLKTGKAVCNEVLLSSVLRSKVVDRVFRCLSGSVSVSFTELERLPLPNPHHLLRLLNTGMDLEDAIAQAYRSTLTASTSAKASERQRRVEAGHP